ncbi:DoxX family protein [Albimonas pacifica]|uniref:Uncharacterized membrane protein YphA, DoxX/SURF4 family n=1 Tax=Albimonas pacifica TaxID=1114924 RepID=A0A1I3GYA1_9RHOB|nr:DoxX family protein [Albimonas pacifica]SFI28433.1 Uncharacterized membrane protein YphA, DoxX/SURF4 family [Albimonas pacifica]
MAPHVPPAARRVLVWLGLLGLCAAYLQGAIAKLFDREAALAEMAHFGLEPPWLFAVGVVAFEFCACAMVLAGRWRRPAAAALGLFTLAATFLALRWWQMPPGLDRSLAANAFFEHLGLAGAWLLVAMGAVEALRGDPVPAPEPSRPRDAGPA